MLLRSLLDDAQSATSSDDLSGSLWSAIEEVGVDATRSPYVSHLFNLLTLHCKQRSGVMATQRNNALPGIQWEPRLCSSVDLLGILNSSNHCCNSTIQYIADQNRLDVIKTIGLFLRERQDLSSSGCGKNILNELRTAHELLPHGLNHLSLNDDDQCLAGQGSHINKQRVGLTEKHAFLPAIDSSVGYLSRSIRGRCDFFTSNDSSVLSTTEYNCPSSSIKISLAAILARICVLKLDESRSSTTANSGCHSHDVQTAARKVLNDHIIAPTRDGGTSVGSKGAGISTLMEKSLTQGSNRDLTYRGLKLLALLLEGSNRRKYESCIANSLFTVSLQKAGEELQRRKQHVKCSSELRQLRLLVGTLSTERANLQQALYVKRIESERDIVRAGEQARAESAELIEFHVEEKVKAKQNAMQMKERLLKADERRRQSEAVLENTSADLGICRASIVELESLLQAEQNKKSARERELEDSMQAQKVTADKLQIMSEQLRETRDKLVTTECIVTDLKKSHDRIQTDLEDSYSKLVALAAAFQSKEKEIQDIEGELQESRRTYEREAKVAVERSAAAKQREKTLTEENNSLREKLKRAMKKLKDEERRRADEKEKRQKEDERRRKEKEKRLREKEEEREMEEERRQKESQRRKNRGPISYINQLHNSTQDYDASFDKRHPRNTQTFEASFDSRRRGTKTQNVEASFDGRHASGKENSIPTGRRRDDSRSSRTSDWYISK